MRVQIEQGRAFIEDCFGAVGLDDQEAAVAADQIIDIELRGAHFGGFSRALTMCDIMAEPSHRRSPITVVRETPVSVLLDGGNTMGYVVATRATELAIEKAKASGIGVAGARNTYYTGQFSYYMEMATRARMVAMAFGSSSPIVAPYGSSEGRFGTNPIAFGFPSKGDPVIVDVGTSSVMLGDLNLWEKTGRRLEPGVAFDGQGNPTLDPAAARTGAVAVWGGHKGSALALGVQLFGLMVGSDPAGSGCGFFFCAVNPELFGDPEAFTRSVRTYADSIQAARPLEPSSPPRAPFSRSAVERRRQIAQGWFEVPDVIIERLEAIAGRTLPAAGDHPRE